MDFLPSYKGAGEPSSRPISSPLCYTPVGGALMQKRYFVLCSNPKCRFNAEKEQHEGGFCPQCGSRLIFGCDTCEKPLTRKGQFCQHCAKDLKAVKP